jgi:NADH-quinone oxidoreductase subunit J
MNVWFLILAIVTVGGTAAAMGLRNAVHCVLALTVGFLGFAALYLLLGAQFVGLTQIMVYVHKSTEADPRTFSSHWLTGATVAAAVFAVLAWAIAAGTRSMQSHLPEPNITVQQIGDALMHRFVVPLEIMGLLLTAALIGAVVIAMDRKEEQK